MSCQLHIAIDGPAGAGKSTVARRVAEHFGLLYVDTGAMYRTVTYAALKYGADITNGRELAAITTHVSYQFTPDGGLRLYIDGCEVNSCLRSQSIDEAVSLVARKPEVRTKLVELQRRIAEESPKGVVMDGRDIGTYVLPHAHLKVFLTANLAERAKRRFRELIAKGQEVTLPEVEADLMRRDQIDSSRTVAPLRKASDAVVVDSTNLSIDEVVTKIISLVEERTHAV